MKQIFHRYQPAYQEVCEQGYPDWEKDPDYANQWWETQFERCANGYNYSRKESISGDYYFHLNFVHGEILDEVRKDKGFGQFGYRDMHHELSNFLFECERDNVNSLVMKGRRAGFTSIMASKLLCRWTFSPGTSLGVGSYGSDYVEKVRSMVNIAKTNLPIEFSYEANDTPKILEAQFKVKSQIGQQKKGTGSKIYYRNFGGKTLNTGAFRSLSAKQILIDESGENPALFKCIADNEECLMEGGEQYGNFVLGGTSNLMNNQCKDLRVLALNPEQYNFRLHVIPRQRFYYLKGHDFCNYEKGTASPQQQENARLHIKAEHEEKEKRENKTAYYSALQEKPTSLEDMLMGAASSMLLPLDRINKQIKILNDYDSLQSRVRKYNIHWKNGKYNPKNPQIEWETTCDDGEYHIIEMPSDDYKFLDIIGCDTYLKSGAPNSTSIGVAYVYRRNNDLDSTMLSNAPICEYAARYPTTDRFYDGILKLAVAYSQSGPPVKILSEYDETFRFFMEKADALKYFKDKPTAIDGIYSNTSHKYMVSMSGATKTRAIKLLQKYCNEDTIRNIGFIRLLNDMKVFGDENTDYAMAFAVCLIHDLDLVETLVTEQKNNNTDDFFPSYTRENGILRPNCAIQSPELVTNFLNS